MNSEHYRQLDVLRQRLTNLSQRNRSLRLPRLSARKDADWLMFSHFEGVSAEALYEKLLSGKRVTLVATSKPHHPKFAEIDRRLTQLHREINTIEAECGTYDLYIGYPFVEGKFNNGKAARSPLCLLPVRILNQVGGARWSVEPRTDAELVLNPVFFHSFEKQNQHRLPAEFMDWGLPPNGQLAIAECLNQLRAHLKTGQVFLDFPSELWKTPTRPFRPYTANCQAQWETGVLRVAGDMVLGIFPQADSAMAEDYHAISQHPADYPLGKVFDFDEESNLESFGANTSTDARLHTPLPVDSSQEAALQLLVSGHDIVVHGPPGTGKSQLIVNAVADAMARGRQVVVVSQKRVALDVVYARLKALNLSQFCFLVHDYRNDRPSIYAQIAKAIQATAQYAQEIETLNMPDWADSYKIQSEELARVFNAEAGRKQAMLNILPCGHALWELFTLTPNRPSAFQIDEFIPEINRHNLEAFIGLAQQIAHYPDLLDAAHPWHHRHAFAGKTFQHLHALETWLEGLAETLTQLVTLVSDFQTNTSVSIFEDPNFDANWALYQTHLETLGGSPALCADYARYRASGRPLIEFKREHSEIQSVRDCFAALRVLDPATEPPVAKIIAAANTYLNNHKKLLKRLSKEWREAKRLLASVLAESGLTTSPKAVGALMKEAELLQWADDWQRKLHSQGFWAELPACQQWKQWDAYLKAKSEHLNWIREYEEFNFLPVKHPRPTAEGGWDNSDYQSILQFHQRMRAACQQWRATWQEMAAYLHENQWLGIKAMALSGKTDRERINTLKQALKQNGEDIIQLDTILGRAEPRHLQLWEVVKRAILHSESSDWPSDLRHAFRMGWLAQAETQFPVVRTVSARGYTTTLDIIRSDYAKWQASSLGPVQLRLRQMALEGRVFNRTGNAVNYKDILHQVSKKRRIWPLRKLIIEHWDNGLKNLMPCILASPETISAVFPMAADTLDLIIFDEASQCPVERGVPAVLRARQVMVAGDEKQLPPYDLFESRANEDGILDELDAIMPTTDSESLLQMSQRCFAEAHLLWHYRSRDERLVAFSNQHFYDNQLLTLPLPEIDAGYCPPLRFEKVDGVWADGRNLVEVEKVIELTKSALLIPEAPSVGIITFNIHQQESVMDALDAEVVRLGAENPDSLLFHRLQTLWTNRQLSPEDALFVKNLENVQGDERDIIIFTIGYAPDASGKLRYQFGLLNQQSGANRLNVAITRAKRQILVVTSLWPNALRTDGLTNQGPGLLKAYLSYVQQISADADFNSPPATGQGETVPALRTVLDEISAAIAAEGFTVHEDVGYSSMKIHLAVKNRDDAGYRLGIIIEDAALLAIHNPKDQLVYRHRWLMQAGWNIHYLYARNWFLQPQHEIAEILKRLESVLA